MKKLFFLGLCLFAARSGFAWGQKGHDVTAYIAECHLTPAAAKKIDKVLGGYSPSISPTGSTTPATLPNMPTRRRGTT